MDETKQRYRLRKLRVFEASLVRAGANQHAQVLLLKQRGGNVKTLKELVEAQEDQVVKAKLAKELDDLERVGIEKADTSKIVKELAQERDRATKLEKQVAELVDARIRHELIEKAAQYELCGLSRAEAAQILFETKDLPAGNLVVKLFEGATEVSKKASVITKQLGHAAPEISPDSAQARIQKSAEALVAAGKATTIHAARYQVYQTSPELMLAEQAELKGAR